MANKKRPHNGLNQTSGGSAVGGAVSGGATSAAPRHPQKFYHYLARHDLAPRGLAQQYKQQQGGHPDWSGFNPFTMVDPGSPYLSETPHLKGRKLDKFNAWMQAANGAAGTPGTTGPGAGTGIDPGSGFAGGFTAGSPGDGISNVGAGSATDPSNFLGISFNYGPGPYVGNGGTMTTLPQPLVDALAPTFPFQSRPGGAGGADSPTGDGGGGDEEGDPIDDPTEPDGPGGQGGGGGGGQHHKKKKNNNNNNHKKNNHHNGGHGGNNHHRNNNGGHSGLRRPANPAHPNAPHLGGNNNHNNNNNHKKRK